MSDIDNIKLPPGYRPDADEPYMNPKQRAYFRDLLLKWKKDLLGETERTLSAMHEEETVFADPTDRATMEADRNFELRARDRGRKLVGKLDRTIETIRADDYGYCEECGVEIGLRRLEARPVTDLCIDCKTKQEQMERVNRGGDDG